MNYARIDGGKIAEAGPLRDDLKSLTDAQRKAVGFLPLVEDDPNCADGETHDGPVVVLEIDRVLVKYNKRPLTQAEKDDALAVAERAVADAETRLAAAEAKLSKLKGI